ncbi:MAG TPA: hypothetical protein VGG99_01205 [Acetobacteraceae bacterium]|jgi:hypothetical protein
MPLVPDIVSRLLANGVGTFGQAYTTMLADGWRRFTDTSSHYASQAATTALEVGLSREGAQDLMLHALHLGRNYMTEMASIPALAFSTAVGQYERQHAVPPPSSNNIRIVENKPIMLPLRFHAARQGWALYLVDADKAQTALGHYGEQFQVCRFNGYAMLMLYGIDFQQTDLGAYHEVGVEISARPKANPLAMPGTVVIRMSVDSQWSVIASNAIWSFEKLYTPRMTPSTQAHRITFPVDDSDTNTLAITLPRFGSARSTDVPIQYFTLDRSDSPRRRQPLCTVFHRTARGEGTQYGGHVDVRLGDGTGKNCYCAVGPQNPRICTCKSLSDLGLPGLRPFANGWAEHMAGRVDPGFAIAPPPVKAAETSPGAPHSASATTPTSPSPRRRTARRPA